MENSLAPQTPSRKKTKKIILTAVSIAVVFVLFMVLWYYVPFLGSNESSYCARCHSMTPEYMTWQYSSHAQFQCSACHEDSGIGGFFKYQGRILKELFSYSSDGSTITKPMSGPIPNSVCLKCHSENRNYSPSSDTIIPHNKHLAKGIRCVDCHAGVAHGRIVERGITAKLTADQWNDSVANEQMDFEFTTPRMSICLDCHGKRQVNQTCSICHSRQLVPTTHKAPDWERQHGLNAQKDFKPCNLCHSYSFNQSKDLSSLSVQEYIRNNTFCFNCHLQKPTTHQDLKFLQTHGSLVQSRGLDNCFSCHNLNKDDSKNNKGPINKVYCNKCHWFTK